ncbi:MAG: hypothetical protein HYX28_02755 [Candidatus Koribacter versatilis]|uniref:Spore coat protein U domain-containing protein n=1 Tax=Candidatus Korobacter versatilis TaxID=658062 RepID=A0A932A6M9_9BACT|nr:hypothetical protein [Candidatus Koribacter versatilis]
MTLLLVVAIAIAAVPALAEESSNVALAGGTHTQTSALTVNVSYVNAMRLVLATGAGAPNCAITPANNTGPYSIDFGQVNGLGVSPSACVAVSGTNPVVYGTNYKVTPTWTGFLGGGTNGTLTVYVSTVFTNNTFLKMREAANVAGLTTDLSTNSAAPQSIGAGNIVSGTTLNRALGVAVTPDNTVAAGPTADSAVVTYTLTVP